MNFGHLERELTTLLRGHSNHGLLTTYPSPRMILQVWLRHKSSSKKALQAALGLLEEHRFDEAKDLLRRLVEIQPPAGASRSSVWYISGEERFRVPANCRGTNFNGTSG